MLNAIQINRISILLLVSLFMFTPFHFLQKLIVIYPIFVIWLISTCVIDKRYLQKSTPFWMFVLCFAILWLVFSFYSPQWEFMHFINHIFLTYMWVLMFVFYKDHLNVLGKMYYLFFVVILVSCIFTINGNLLQPGASRHLGSGLTELSYEKDMAIALHVGGFGFIYSLTFLIPPIVIKIKHNNRALCMWLMLFTLIATIIIASYFMAILFAFFFVFMSLSSTRNMTRTVLLLAVLSVVIYVVKDNLLMGLIDFGDYINSPMLRGRAEQMLLGTYQSTYDETGHLSRIELIQNGALNFLDSPIVGQMTSRAPSRPSGHSEMIGYFEKYGMFGLIYVYFFVKIYKVTTLSFETKPMRILYNFLFVGIISLVSLNTFSISCEAGLTVFFFVPILMLVFERDYGKNHIAKML